MTGKEGKERKCMVPALAVLLLKYTILFAILQLYGPFRFCSKHSKINTTQCYGQPIDSFLSHLSAFQFLRSEKSAQTL